MNECAMLIGYGVLLIFGTWLLSFGVFCLLFLASQWRERKQKQNTKD